MRILIWATTLQADILALSLALDKHPDHQVLIAATNKDAYLTQAMAHFRPFKSQLIERDESEKTQKIVKDFRPDVTIVDNHFPKFSTSKKICNMWHGIGWKARGKKDNEEYHKRVTNLTGRGPELSNPDFIATCYGEEDKNWRIQKAGIHEDNCKLIGMPFSDLVLNPPYTKQQIANRYSIPILDKKTVLVNFTWHYGHITSSKNKKNSSLLKLFSRNKSDNFAEDRLFLNELCSKITAENANILFCMHDSWRYSPEYLEIFKDLEISHPGSIQIKHKDQHPDNLADLLIADVMVTNLSSFITYFYYLERPSIHLCPVAKDENNISFAKVSKKKGLRFRQISKSEDVYMNQPEDNGGLTVYDKNDCIDKIVFGLHNSDCSKKRSRDWLETKIDDSHSGNSCQRYIKVLEDFVG